MKPDTRTAMRRLIDQVRAAIPFDTAQTRACVGDCTGCSQKLLDYLEGELAAWDQRLAEGDRPSLADLSRLAKTGRKIHRVLVRNGILSEEAKSR
jgi:glutathione S-transferase